MNTRQATNWTTLLLIMLTGAIIFAYLGEILITYVPIFTRWGAGSMVGIPAISLNLSVIKLSFSLLVKVNLFTVVGLVAGFLVFRRL
ncbi:MAG: DUF4321 domain-containing protein [Methylocystaceae bacterium]